MQETTANETRTEKAPALFRAIRRTVRAATPKYTLYGAENLPEEPCVIVGNHCQLYGPIAAELYMPRPHYTWCIGEMMNRKEVPAYAYEDFWPEKAPGTHWYFHMLSHLIAGPMSYVLNHVHAIPVYHDARVVTTMRSTIAKLNEGADIVIFPECHEPYNGILWQFQEHFADLAQMVYRRTGKAVCFVPAYFAPRLAGIHFGKPVRFDPAADADAERKRVCAAMLEGITDLATALPEHRVVPYPNIRKKDYPRNTDVKPVRRAES